MIMMLAFAQAGAQRSLEPACRGAIQARCSVLLTSTKNLRLVDELGHRPIQIEKNQNGPLLHARVGMLKAMNHGHERVFSERAELARLQAILTKTGRRTSKKLREF
jgi:hypothetical protein